MKKICLPLDVSFTMTLTTANAADFDKGLDAYNAGDFETAFVEFGELAEQGDADAQYYLGNMYYNGEGVEKNFTEAAKWFAFAAEQGDATAQLTLGIMYKYAEGVEQDYAYAAELYSLAAKQGDTHAQFNLGIMYENRTGVVQSYVVAHMWLNISVANGREGAASERDWIAANKLTRASIIMAQELASICLASNYGNCGY